MRNFLIALAIFVAMTAPSHADPAAAQAGLSRLVAFDATAGTGVALVIEINTQRLYVFEAGKLVLSYPVSTSKFGIGSEAGSNKTPLGIHRIRQKIGDGAPSGTIFRARQNTHRRATIIQDAREADADYVTSRILWLDGMEEGRNRGTGVDSYQRFIYIHGTAEEGFIGRPASHGCIRMTNAHVIHLFARVPATTLVLIIE
jgi:lipoprotein-anchoring transpeptidase ErfK/SrfK